MRQQNQKRRLGRLPRPAKLHPQEVSSIHPVRSKLKPTRRAFSLKNSCFASNRRRLLTADSRSSNSNHDSFRKGF